MQNQDLDLLKFAQDKSIQKLLDAGEQILFSACIVKFNRKNKKQERNFMVTNTSVYNLSKTSLKRKIAIQKIAGISYSISSGEFVLHVPDEYDYRYQTDGKRDHIVSLIIRSHEQLTSQGMKIFFLDDISLERVTTTKDDKKKKLDRMPQTGHKLMDFNQFNNFLKGSSGNQTTLYGDNHITIDDFNLLKVLGRGAFGKVMLVEKKDTKEKYALKSIRKEDIIDKDQIEHTKTERVVLEHCNHNFLVNLKFAFTTPDKIFFVTQFMRGGELFQHLKQAQRFDERRAKFYAAEIALALGHLHSQNIIYRDLKPENILMDDEGHICLTDFGMAKIMRKGELAQSFCGTPEYLSPEMINGDGYTASTDWWALGIFTFEMLHALPPFYDENQDKMFDAIQKKNIHFPSHTKTTNEAKDFILKATEKDPSKRIGTKGGLAEVKAHPWFADIDWKNLENKSVKPPFKPDLKKWEEYFDEEFTKEKPINSYVPNKDQKMVDEYQEEFEDFSFVPEKKLA